MIKPSFKIGFMPYFLLLFSSYQANKYTLDKRVAFFSAFLEVL
jgi:hypothetical protein